MSEKLIFHHDGFSRLALATNLSGAWVKGIAIGGKAKICERLVFNSNPKFPVVIFSLTDCLEVAVVTQ